jgi:hypothetical protein
MSFTSIALASILTIGASDRPATTFAYDTPPTPVCGSTIHTVVGQAVNFTVSVTNTDPNEAVALLFLAGPPGSVLSGPNPIVVFGDGVNPINITNDYSWTPAPGQVGDFFVTWDSADLTGTRLFCTVTIHVDEKPPEGCTYTPGGWGARPQGNNAAAILKNNFGSVFPTGIEIGIAGAGGFSAKFTTAKAVENFLPAGGIPGVLTSDSTNPLTTAAGVFAGHVLALTINVAMSAAGKIPDGPIGDLELCNFGGSLDGKTISQVLADANFVLGGGALGPDYASVSDLNNLLELLNEAFDNCVASEWALGHLCEP